MKHRILATFNIKKKNQSQRLYAFKDILIQQEFITIGKARTNIPERKITFTLRNLTLNIDRPVVFD
jgi:hypothetical protein